MKNYVLNAGLAVLNVRMVVIIALPVLLQKKESSIWCLAFGLLAGSLEGRHERICCGVETTAVLKGNVNE